MENKIRVLPPSIAERIAAGEVVERPASVVKELIENSLDAGATDVAVLLKDGGKSLIEVIDNGSGMSARDLEVCIERHATSKLSTLEDLEAIFTLGFRGEALASISAVAEVTLVSRQKGSVDTHEVLAGDLAERLGAHAANKPQAKKITFGHFLNFPHGTRIQAQGLFSQIPARLKFLKSQSAEVSQVRDCLERLALSHPHVGFKLLSDERVVFQCKPESEESRIKTILSDGEDFPIITVSNEQDGFRDIGLQIRVHWIQGMSSGQSRKLIQIVNSRVVKDRMLQQALMNPFRQALLPGQYPSVVLSIRVNPAAIDVNVHPTKTEIRFLDTRKIFQSIDSLIRNMIVQNGAPAMAPPRFQLGSDSGQLPSWSASSSAPWSSAPSSSSSFSSPNSSSSSNYSSWRAAEDSRTEIGHGFSLSSTPGHVDYRNDFESTGRGLATPPVHTFDPIPAGTRDSELSTINHPLQFARQVGILFNTYLVYELGSEIVMVDQHAAHERIRYEKLRKRLLSAEVGASQSLLIPEVIKFPIEDRSSLEDRLEWMSQLGFEAEVFGEDSLVFRAVPAEWGTQQLKVRLKNLTQRVLDFKNEEDNGEKDILSKSAELGETPPKDLLPKDVLMDERLFEKLASEACHSSVRAGDVLELAEARALVEQLFQCTHPWNCPHGRPTVVKVPQGKLEEWFQRKI